ncbi:hypothetical protein BDV59DRAFT_172456 [Aspergillus ambiguus]|uniref:uncharacterized protein n=1 Tax=Aspergillus ambiguus TaxID=176160 RepID=UPI003CCCF577
MPNYHTFPDCRVRGGIFPARPYRRQTMSALPLPPPPIPFSVGREAVIDSSMHSIRFHSDWLAGWPCLLIGWAVLRELSPGSNNACMMPAHGLLVRYRYCLKISLPVFLQGMKGWDMGRGPAEMEASVYLFPFFFFPAELALCLSGRRSPYQP